MVISATAKFAQFQIHPSSGWANWLRASGVSLALTSYQTNRLVFLGRDAGDRPTLVHRYFDRAMGLSAHNGTLHLAGRFQLWQLHNQLRDGALYQGCDRLYVPQQSITTGDINAHELAIAKLPSELKPTDDNQTFERDSPQLVFVNTAFSCLSVHSPGYSFMPVWQPPFISKLAPEDRCHLNGMAIVDGEVRYVTVCRQTDEAAGWRRERSGGGAVLHVPSGEAIATGLSMPHSPRWYQGKLWLLNSGTGELGYIDGDRFEPVTFCPGFARGLAFVDDFAIVGTSKPRTGDFSGLTLEERFTETGLTAECGLSVVDLRSGQIVASCYLSDPIREVFDVVALPGVRQPGLLGMDQDEADRLVTFPGSGVVTIKPTTKKALTIPIAAPDQEPERAIASNLSTATTFDISQIRFQKVFHLNPKNLEEYDDLTFPRLKKRWKNYQQQGEIFGISASFSESIIGLAIAEVMPDNIANLISLFVQTPYRNKGIGTRLLTYSMKESRQQECEAIQLNYHATESTLALERILEKLRCQKPKTQFFLGRATIANFVENPSKGRVHLPPESQVFPWTGLTKAEGETIKSIGESGAYPSEVCPFGNDPRLESTTSLGIRYNESVVGWLVTHRVSEDTIRYTHWWTLEPYRSQGWSIALLAAALDRQIAANIPYATFAVSAKEKPMVRFFQRRMMPYLDYTSESKTLLQPLK